MKVKNQAEYDDWKNKNNDPYGQAIFRFAEKWANLMEKEINTGALLERIAEKASVAADGEGITGFMYGAAVSILAHCWEHGEALKKWHNKSYGKEDSKGVVNPAILTVG